MYFEPEHGGIAFAARVDYRKPGPAFPLHRHSQLELILVESGVYQFMVEDDAELFSAGDVYLVNSEKLHRGKIVQPGRYYYVQISLRQFPKGINEELDRLITELETHRIVLPMRMPAEQAKETGIFMRGMELVDCFSQKNGYNELKVFCKSLAILQLISEHRLFRAEKSEKRGESSFIQQVAEYMDVHYAEEVRLEQVAAWFGYEPHYFCSLFKKRFLVSFTHYLRVVRVQKFLSHPELNLQTIAKCAADVGFSNYSYFYQSFRRVRGCSPRQFLMRTRK